MLKMRVYSERIVDKNGIITKVGEDALPYVNEAGMFVADGMGGGAGVFVMAFHPDCFDSKKLGARLQGIISEPFQDLNSQEEFAEYIRENFASLTDPAMGQLYQNAQENVQRLKKSGYVGSHALGVVMTAWLLKLAEQKRKNFNDKHWEERIETLKSSLFEYYKKAVNLLGSEYVQVSLNKIDYYGTTLSAAFFKECEDFVEVVFLNCGDSRSYIWDSDGFRQASEDQGRNGGMISKFSLAEGVAVEISFEKKRYRKPCVVFCMTDGIYGSFGGENGFHSSPLRMEGYLMNVFQNSSSLQEAEQRLKSVFDKNGGIDDSNSMVMAAFGFESYEMLKINASKRLETLNQMYLLPELPDDFLLKDYQKKVSELQQRALEKIKPLLQDAYQQASVREYCMDRITLPEFCEKYCDEAKRIESELKEAGKRNSKLYNELERLAKENYIDFVNENEIEQWSYTKFGIFNSPQDNVKEFGKAYNDFFIERNDYIKKLAQNFKDGNDIIKSSLDSIYMDENQLWTSPDEQTSIKCVENIKNEIDEMLQFAKNSLGIIKADSKNLTNSIEQWESCNSKIAENYAKRKISTGLLPQDLVLQWITSKIPIEKILPATTIPSVRKKIIELVEEYQSNSYKIERMESELCKAREQAAYEYWSDEGIRDISGLIGQDKFLAEDHRLKWDISDRLNPDSELKYYQQYCDHQKKVFDHYLDEHLREMSEDKKADVKRNGWI